MINQTVVIYFLKSAHSVLAKKFINQTVDIISQLRLGSKKIIKPICSDFVFSKCQMLISKNITKPFCSHFQCSVLMSKIIIEPICSDLVLKSAHSVLAKKFINQTVDIIGQLRLGWCWFPRKLKKQFVVTLCFQLWQVLISKKISKPICSHFQCSELISKKIAEPICSDFVFSVDTCWFPRNFKTIL